MNSVNVYKYAAIGLAILNIGLISFFLIIKPKHQQAPSQRPGITKAIELLRLDDAQNKSFLLSADRNRVTMDSISDVQRNILKNYFLSLTNDNKMLSSRSDVNEFIALEEMKLTATYDHFKEIKSFLREDQSADFQLFMSHIITTRFSNQKRMPPRPKDR